MDKNMIMTIVLTLVLAVMLTGCKDQPLVPTNTTQPLFNESLNQQIENLTNTVEAVFKEFNYTPVDRPDAKYEILEDDIFTLANGSFNSSEISFLGVKIGDSYEQIIKAVGIPDVMYVSADKSYRNLEYGKKIGINSTLTAITYHVENDTLTQVIIRRQFKRYMNGNTSIDVDKDTLYRLIDTPDYIDFQLSIYKVFHYVEKGVDIYLKGDNAHIFVFKMPREFKGVNYVTKLTDMGGGIVVNVTEPVLID
ncbi:MAG: hypothetical protein V1866_01735 [archaeon]